MVTRIQNGSWTTPEPASFNTKYIDNEPHITPDGKYLFFCNQWELGGCKNYYRIKTGKMIAEDI